MRVLTFTILTLCPLAVMSAGCNKAPNPAQSNKSLAPSPAPPDAGEFVLNVPAMR